MDKQPKIKTEIYKNLPINVIPSEKQYCYTNILDDAYSQLEAMLSRYAKVFVYRFDLRFVDQCQLEVDETKTIAKYFKAVTRIFERKYGCEIAYQWVREVERAKKAHFHCWIALSGHKCQVPGVLSSDLQPEGAGLLGVLQQKWDEVSSGGSLWLAGKDHSDPKYRSYKGHMLKVSIDDRRLESAENAHECFYHLSYMAKCRGKSYGLGVRNYGTSRLKPLGLFNIIPSPPFKSEGGKIYNKLHQFCDN